jgi:hypothetical protein
LLPLLLLFSVAFTALAAGFATAFSQLASPAFLQLL